MQPGISLPLARHRAATIRDVTESRQAAEAGRYAGDAERMFRVER